MSRLHVYSPVVQNRHKFLGGTLGGIYRKVMNHARNFARSSTGQKLKRGIKRKILEAGSEVVERVLSGEPPLRSLQNVSKRMKKTVPRRQLKKIKSTVFPNNRSKVIKKGGLVLYRLNKKKTKWKKGRRASKKTQKREVLYKLQTKGKYKRRKQQKRRANKRITLFRLRGAKSGRRRRKRSPTKRKGRATKRPRRKTRKQLVGGARTNRKRLGPFANTVFDL